MRKILCIGRQFGSGGHQLAKNFAERAGIDYHDKKLIDRAIEKSGLSRVIMEKADERVANPFLQPVYYEGNSPKYYGKNANDILFEAQKEVILEEAAANDCVFVGRCADYILKKNTDYCVRSIFIAAPMDYRIQRTMERDRLNEKDAAAKIRKMDKARSAYYNYYTDCDWGKPSDYDYCINMASNSEEEILHLLMQLFNQMNLH